MSTRKSTIPPVPAQQPLFLDADPASQLAVSRRCVIDAMRAAAGALNVEILRLESTGNFDETEIDRSYERLAHAVSWFEEERLAAEFEAEIRKVA